MPGAPAGEYINTKVRSLHMPKTCPQCRDITEQKNIPHVVRHCPGCGRELHVHEPGKHGRGFRIRKGDRVVVPNSWLKISLNPLKSTGKFSRYGLNWFATQIWLGRLPAQKASIRDELTRLEEQCDELLNTSELLSGFDLEDPAQADRIIQTLKEHTNSPEWWRFSGGAFLSLVRDAIANNDIDQAIWAMACAERCRSMCIFKEHLEEVVWMGHSAKRVVDVLQLWDGNKSNADESFWQATFRENSYVLSQVFAVPMIFIQDNAYVGGMKISGRNAKFVDYLFSLESSREAILVEIKSPTTPLLGSKYRGVRSPSAKLTGAVVQVLDYRSELANNLQKITADTGHDLKLFHPRCVVIAGNCEQFSNKDDRKPFELFRGSMKDVEIVTYDELFRKVEVLANLFSLLRTGGSTNGLDTKES